MTDKMTRQRVVEAIATARAKNRQPYFRGADLSGLYLGGLDLAGVDFSGADVRNADFSGAIMDAANMAGVMAMFADFSHAEMKLVNCANAVLAAADFTGANMYGANFHNATLSRRRNVMAIFNGAYMMGANFAGVDLALGDVAHADMPCLVLWGLPSGGATFAPTSRGWRLTIGCWSGTTNRLRAMVSQDEGWPEARGDQVTARRPGLLALADTCDAFAAYHDTAVEGAHHAAKRWGTE